MLHDAALDGKIDDVKELLSGNMYGTWCIPAVDDRNHRGRTPLQDAAWGGHHATVELLLDRGADIEAKNRQGWTALMNACARGQTMAARLLLDRGADVQGTNNAGRSSLMWAAFYGHAGTCALLAERGADLDHECDQGETALRCAQEGNHPECISLLENLIAARSADARKEAAFISCVKRGDADGVQSLMLEGCNPEAKDPDLQWSVLMIACVNGFSDVCRALLAKGATPSATTADGQTCLMGASMSGHAACVKLLLDAGVDAEAQSLAGATALDLAREGGHGSTIALLEAARALFLEGQLVQACEQGDEEKVARLLADGVSADAAVEKTGMTALMWAAARGQKGCASLLLEARCDHRLRSVSGRTALEYAAYFAEQAIEYPYCKGQPDRPVPEDGERDTSHEETWTLIESTIARHRREARAAREQRLLAASEAGDEAGVLAVLDEGAALHCDVKNDRGISPLMWCAAHGLYGAAAALLEHGASLTVRGDSGKSAIDYARGGEHMALVALLSAAYRERWGGEPPPPPTRKLEIEDEPVEGQGSEEALEDDEAASSSLAEDSSSEDAEGSFDAGRGFDVEGGVGGEGFGAASATGGDGSDGGFAEAMELAVASADSLGLLGPMQSARLDDDYDILSRAVAFCRAEGATSADELVQYARVDALIAALGPLPPIPEARLREVLYELSPPPAAAAASKAPKAPSITPSEDAAVTPMGDDEVEGLRELLEGVKLTSAIPKAIAWCAEMGVDSVSEIREVEAEEGFVNALELLPLKKALLLKRFAAM